MSEPQLTGYEVDEQGVALLRLERPEARNAINTQMLERAARAPRGRRADEAGARARHLLHRPHGPLRRRRRPGGARRGGHGPPDAALRRPLRRARRLPEADGRRLPRRRASAAAPRSRSPATCGSAGSNLRLRFPGAALGVPVGPARLVTLCRPRRRQVPAALRPRRSAPTRRCAGASSTGSPPPPRPRRPP